MSVLKELINANNSLSQGKSTKASARASVRAGGLSGENDVANIASYVSEAIGSVYDEIKSLEFKRSLYVDISKLVEKAESSIASGSYKKAYEQLVRAESLNDEIMPISARVSGISEARRELSLIVKK